MAEEFPTLNGIAPSWADLKITGLVYDGEDIDVEDVSDISWSDPIEIGVQRGTGGSIRRRTTGQSTPEASMTLYRSGWRKLKRALAAKAPSKGGRKRIGVVGFDILVQHTPPGESEIYKVKIEGCRIKGRSMSMTEGVDPDKVEVPLFPIAVVEIDEEEEVIGV